MDSIPREIIHHINDNNDNENQAVQARQVNVKDEANNNNNSVKEEEEEEEVVDEDKQWKQMLETGRDYFPRINRDREDDPILLNDDDDDIDISSSSTSSSSSSSFSSSTEEGNSRSGVFDYYNNDYNDENTKQSDDDRIPLLSDQDDQNRRKKGSGTNEIINSMKETLNTAVEDLDDWFIGRGRKGTNNNNNNNDSKSVMNNNNNLKNHNLSSIRYNDPIETLKEETKQQQQQHHFETFHPEEETQHEQYDDNEEKEIPFSKIKTSSVFLTTGRQNTQEKEITTEQLYKWNRHNTLHINSSSSATTTTTTATNKKKKLEFLFFLLVAYAVVSYYNTASKTTTTIIGGYNNNNNNNNIENNNNNININLRGEQLEQAQQQQQETINTINSNSWFPTLKQQQSQPQQQVQQQQIAEFEYPQMEFLDREKEESTNIVGDTNQQQQLHDMTGMEDDMVVVIEHIRTNNHDTDHPTQQTQMQQQEQDPSQANQQPLMTDVSTPLSEMLLNIMGTKVPKQQGGSRVDGLLPIFWLVPPTSYISKSVFNIFDDCLDFTRSVLSYDSDQHVIEYVSTIPQLKEEEGEDIKEDIIIASNLMNLFQIINPSNPKHKHHQKGLAFTFLQHPVERAAQYFDYLKGAAQRHTNSNYNDEDVSFLPTGEQIDPAIAKMNLLEYARYRTSTPSSSSTVSAYENNFLVRSLSQVPMNVPLHGGFVSHAEQVLRSHFIVGLVDDEQIMMESFLRIFKWIQVMNYGGGLNGDDGGLNGKELLLAQNLNDPNLNECIHGLLPPLVKNKRVMEGSEEYHLLAQLNKYDMIFYQNVHHIFEEQGKSEIFSSASN